jgi:hypothetical protein
MRKDGTSTTPIYLRPKVSQHNDDPYLTLTCSKTKPMAKVIKTAVNNRSMNWVCFALKTFDTISPWCERQGKPGKSHAPSSTDAQFAGRVLRGANPHSP